MSIEVLQQHPKLIFTPDGEIVGPLGLIITVDGKHWSIFNSKHEPFPLESVPAEARKEIDALLDSFEAKYGEGGSTGRALVDSLPQIVDVASFLAENIEPPRELVHGVIHQGGKVALGAGSKGFKSWVQMDLSVSVATGEPWLSFKTSKARVLYLNMEIQTAFIQGRLKAIADAKMVDIPPGAIDLWNLRGHSASYDVIIPKIIDRIKDNEYGLIVLDPIYKLYGDTDENSAGAIARLMNSIESLTVASGATASFAAHYSKGNQASKESIDRMSGSGVFSRDPDSILSFTPLEERGAFAVEMTLRNFKPVDPFAVRWLHPLMRRDDGLDPRKLKMAKTGRPSTYLISDFLPHLRGKMTTSEWQKTACLETGASRATFHRVLKDAGQEPNLKKTKAGKWFHEKPKEAEGESHN